MRLFPRKALLAAAVAGLAGHGTAAMAQGIGIDIYAGAPYDYYSDYYYPNDPSGYGYRYAPPPPPPPRVYGYTSEVIGPPGDVLIPLRPSNCGEFHYWNGVRCADARVEPPSVR